MLKESYRSIPSLSRTFVSHDTWLRVSQYDLWARLTVTA